MTARRLAQFSGEIPRLSRRLLPDPNGQVASNVLMTSGNINPIYGPKATLTHTGSGELKSVFRMYDAAGTDYWLQWTSDVDVAKGPVTGDTSFRIYFTSDSFEPRVTDLSLATTGGATYPVAWYVLGVTPPVTKPTVTPSGGSGATETRAYIYTFVTQWGEESAPSPASTATSGYINATWGLIALDAAPSNSYTISAASWAGNVLTLTVNSTFGLRAGEHVTISGLAPLTLNASWKVASVVDGTHFTISMANPGTITDQTGTATRDAPHNTTNMVKRIYRTVTSATGTDYYFIAEIPVATTTYNDTVTVIGEPCPTIGWAMPPVDLRGVCVHPSGALCGFTANEECFSEPLAPYAWPLAYRLTTDYPIVGNGVFGQSVFIGTSGTPYVASGVEPASMSMQKLEQPWPCVAKRSIVPMGDGVAYASTNGLATVSMAGPQMATAEFYTFAEWALVKPATIVGGYHDGRYYGGFWTDASTGNAFVFGQGSLTFTAAKVSGMFSDPATGKLYIIDNNVLYEWMGDIGTRMVADWMSKEFVEPNPVSFSAAKVDADFTQDAASQTAAQANYNAILAANQALITSGGSGGSVNGASMGAHSLNGSGISPLPPLTFNSLVFTFYKDGTAVFTKQVLSSKVFRLPAVGKYDNWSVRVSGNVPIQSVVIGDTPLSLKAV